jgi:pimeloyl-ACP methyl ester carboxylesterase
MKSRWIETAQGRLLACCWQPPEQREDRRGEPPPIVLFHDSLGCIALWREFPAVLAELTGRTVIAYDRLGFGQSDPRTGRPGVDFIREEAESIFPSLREQLGFDRFIAFGHSVGGGMAVHCAGAYTAACEALITEAAQAFVDERIRAGIRTAKAQFDEVETFQRLQRYHGERARWVLDAWIETWLSSEFSDWSLESVLPGVQCPTLVIHGRDDEYGSSQHPEAIARLTGGPSQLEIIAGLGHVPHREQPHAVAVLVARFIGRMTPAPIDGE